MKHLISLVIAFASAYNLNAQAEIDTIKYNSLAEVKVSATANRLTAFVESTQMGKVDLPISMLAKAPSIAGEPDVIKALQLTPGVKRGTEGSIGMHVRGGGNDENLILLDGAPVYNAGHLLGFFSIFNTAAVKDVQLYKSSFPAQYGGRLSSVMDVRTKEGSLTDMKANASIGMIASSATIQGPIIKDKLSLIVSGRRTYLDKVLRYIPYHFHDVNAKTTYVLNESNRIYFSLYSGEDKLTTNNNKKDSIRENSAIRTKMALGNQVMVLRWNNISTERNYVTNVSLIQSKFKYRIDGEMMDNTLSMSSAINDHGIKADIRSTSDADHQMSGGFNIMAHHFNPNIVNSKGRMTERFANSDGQNIYTTEAAVFVNDDYTINDRWEASAGIRLSGTAVKGKLYMQAEPRVSLRYLIDIRNSVKISYARMAQYMHLVSSSSLALPTDLWYPVTETIKPGISDQLSAGYYHTIAGSNVSISIEAYYKKLSNLVEYKEGALLALNNDYEKELVQGKGSAYGIEFFVTKTAGKFTGWAGYSLSFADRQFDSLNNGKKYYSRYDRRHDLSLVGMYDISKRWAISSTLVYSTGNPFTGQSSQYFIPKPDFSGFDMLPAYTDRNALRLSSTFRIDMSLQYKFEIGRRVKGDAQLCIYNLMNRTQPHTVQRVWDEKKATYKYQQKGLFGTVTAATINFNI